MGIVNLTPDSFSDGGEQDSWEAVATRIDEMVELGAQLLDFGAESTRPRATPLSADEEWIRLEAMLARVLDKFRGDPLRPRFSIDTYHVAVARRALELGVDVINDVSGLTQPAMLELAADSNADFIAMHNLGLPADPDKTLETGRSAVDQVDEWLDDRTAAWTKSGIDPGRIIFDPGIGFGKNPLQSLELLRHISRFRQRGLRILVGHSRKSYMKSFSRDDHNDRDLITVGASMALCERGVDILRVHNLPAHALAYRGWAHLHDPAPSFDPTFKDRDDVIGRPLR
jgi:dihydropteroate synthase